MRFCLHMRDSWLAGTVIHCPGIFLAGKLFLNDVEELVGVFRAAQG